MQRALRASARLLARPCTSVTSLHSLQRRAFAMPTDRSAPVRAFHPSGAGAAQAATNAAAEEAGGEADTGVSPRVLSIQSHVVHGFVGNKCAAFPLQLLGFEVDPIMSVQFSNHTGYPTFKGHVFDGSHLGQLLEGLEVNGLLHYTHLLTGYIGSISLLQAVKEAAVKLKEANPNFVYVCDPVMGDEGRMYVTEQLLNTFRSDILPLATLLTPNDFEAELLTGSSISTVDDAVEAAAQLHAMGPPTVVITSMSAPQPAAAAQDPFGLPGQPSRSGSGSASSALNPEPDQQQPPSSAPSSGAGSSSSVADGDTDTSPSGANNSSSDGAAGTADSDDVITLVASTVVPQRHGQPQRFTVTVPRLQGYYTGTGDLLSALLLAWTHRHPGDLATAVLKAVAGLQGVLRATAAAAADPSLLTSKERSAEVFRARELRLVQNRHCVEQPLESNHRSWLRLQPLP